MFAVQFGYKCLNKQPLPHHLFFISLNRVVWHWINLSHIEKGSHEDKVTALILPLQVPISLHLLLLPSPSSPPLPVCLLQLQLTPKVTFGFFPASSRGITSAASNDVAITYRPIGVTGGEVSRWQRVRKRLRVHRDLQPAAVCAGVYGWHLAPNQSPSRGTEAHTYRRVLLEGSSPKRAQVFLKKQVSSLITKTSASLCGTMIVLQANRAICSVIIQLWEKDSVVSL